MSLSEIVIRLLGLVLAIVGFCLLLAVVNVPVFGISFQPLWAEIVLGVCFLGAGIYIVRGGNISL